MSKMKTNIALLFLSKLQAAFVQLYKATPIMRNYTFRLAPGQDLFDSMEAFVKEKHIEAGCVLSCVGSLMRARLRLADREFSSEYDGPFEVVSLTGTVSIHGSHLHISVSDGVGRTIGGILSRAVRFTRRRRLSLRHLTRLQARVCRRFRLRGIDRIPGRDVPTRLISEAGLSVVLQGF